MSQFQTMPDIAGITKIYYPDGGVPLEVYEDQPFMGMIRKEYDLGGASWNEPLIYGDVQNSSATFSTAMAGVAQYYNIQWAITPTRKYNVGSIETLTMYSARGGATSFLDSYDALVASVRRGLQRALAVNMFRSSTGSVAQLISTQIVSSTTASLANPADITALELGMNIAVSATDGSASKGTAFITSINQANGTFQVATTYNGTAVPLNTAIPTIAAGDYIYRSAGDIGLCFPGVSDWLIGSNVTSTPFYGVDRTKSVTRLAGIYYDGSGQNLEDALISAAALAKQEGAGPDVLFVNSNGYAQMERMFVNRVIYPSGQFYDPNTPEFGFQRFRVSGGLSGMTVFMDNTVPDGYAFMLKMNTWKLKSVGPLLSLYDADGTPAKRSDTVDGMTFRLFSYPALVCNAPGQNVRIKLPIN